MTLTTSLRWVFCGSLFAIVLAQTTTHCVNGATAVPACDNWYSQQSRCGAFAKSSSVTSYYNCYCAQSYFNGIWDCESEERLCLGSSDLDPYFDPIKSLWHKACDPVINYSLTTPVLSSITDSYNPGWCTVASSSCASLDLAEASCTAGYTSGLESSLTSCLCQTNLISLAYTCSYLGNVSCILTPAALSNIPAWTHCSDFDAVLASTGVTATTSSPTTTSAFPTPVVSSSPPTITTSPASPASTAASSSPATTKTGAASRLEQSSNLWTVMKVSGLVVALLVGG